MKQSLSRYTIIFGVGLTSLLVAVLSFFLADTYLPNLYFQTGRIRQRESHPLHLLIFAYLWGAHWLSQSKHPKASLALKIIAAPGYLAILTFIVLLIIGPF
jgi:hypothetical protein